MVGVGPREADVQEDDAGLDGEGDLGWGGGGGWVGGGGVGVGGEEGLGERREEGEMQFRALGVFSCTGTHQWDARVRVRLSVCPWG